MDKKDNVKVISVGMPDLKLFEHVFSEFKESLKLAESYKNDGKTKEAITELGRAYGVLSTLMQEGSLLCTDLLMLQKTVMGGAPMPTAKDLAGMQLSDILGDEFGDIVPKSKSKSTKN